MGKERLSFDIDTDEYEFLKMCCEKLNVGIEEFMAEAVVRAIHDQEDEWFEELGTMDEIEKILADPGSESIPIEEAWKRLGLEGEDDVCLATENAQKDGVGFIPVEQLWAKKRCAIKENPL